MKSGIFHIEIGFFIVIFGDVGVIELDHESMSFHAKQVPG
jgi:hypothetical protein